MTDRNAWVRENNSLLRSQNDLEGIVLSPGAAGGLTALPDVSGGNDQITIDLVAPSPLPAGWTIVAAVGAAIKDQDPQSGTDFEIHAQSDNTSTYSVVLTGLSAGLWQATGWFVFQRSASPTDLAYGAGPTFPVTVT